MKAALILSPVAFSLFLPALTLACISLFLEEEIVNRCFHNDEIDVFYYNIELTV